MLREQAAGIGYYYCNKLNARRKLIPGRSLGGQVLPHPAPREEDQSVLPGRYLCHHAGKNVVQTPAGRCIEDGVINFDATLHLNTDQSALDTQRVVQF